MNHSNVQSKITKSNGSRIQKQQQSMHFASYVYCEVQCTGACLVQERVATDENYSEIWCIYMGLAHLDSIGDILILKNENLVLLRYLCFQDGNPV